MQKLGMTLQKGAHIRTQWDHVQPFFVGVRERCANQLAGDPSAARLDRHFGVDHLKFIAGPAIIRAAQFSRNRRFKSLCNDIVTDVDWQQVLHFRQTLARKLE